MLRIIVGAPGGKKIAPPGVPVGQTAVGGETSAQGRRFRFAANVPTTHAMQFNHLIAGSRSQSASARNTLVHDGTNKGLCAAYRRAFLPRTVENKASMRRTSASTSAPGSMSGPKRTQRAA